MRRLSKGARDRAGSGRANKNSAHLLVSWSTSGTPCPSSSSCTQ